MIHVMKGERYGDEIATFDDLDKSGRTNSKGQDQQNSKISLDFSNKIAYLF